VRKHLIVLLIFALLLPVAASSESEKPTFSLMGYDHTETYRDWSTNLFFERLAQRTGVTFTFQQYTESEAYHKALAGLTADGDLPDVLFKADLSPAESMQLLERGVLVDLKPFIEQYAPNLVAILAQKPEVEAAITLPNGAIASLPFINEAPAQNCMWINQDWLTALKLNMPTTVDELTSVLEAFKTRDPNRNGKNDEVPLAFIGAYDLKYLAHAYGLTANDFNLFERDGKAVFMPLEPEFRTYITWLNDLYTRRLIDRDGFSTMDALRRVTDAKATPVYGILLAPLVSSVLPAEWTASYRVVPPLTYQGQQVYRTIADPVTTGTFAITAACKDAGAALAWVDYLYSEEGATLALAGQEGVDYVVDGDGTWRKTDITSQPGYLSESGIMTGTVPPGISNDAFQRRYSDQTVRNVSEQIDIVSAIAQTPFPTIPLTQEQADYIAPLQAAIGRYVDESIARWTIGEWELTDEQFAEFSQQLAALGLQEFMTFWQEKLDQHAEVHDATQ